MPSTATIPGPQQAHIRAQFEHRTDQLAQGALVIDRRGVHSPLVANINGLSETEVPETPLGAGDSVGARVSRVTFVGARCDAVELVRLADKIAATRSRTPRAPRCE